jgi:hypothetical protein
VGSGEIHQRLLNRHVGTRTEGAAWSIAGFGHNASTAAMIAATSSSEAEGEIAMFTE